MEATAKIVEGETSGEFALIDASKFSAVSLSPYFISENFQVLADQSTITLSSYFQFLKSLIFFLISYNIY